MRERFLCELLQYSSSGEEDEGAAARPKCAAAKKGKSSSKVKGRAPSKNKCLLPGQPPAQKDREGEGEGEDQFMPGPAAGIGDLLSSFDPFAEAERDGCKTLTTVQGLSAGYNYARILRGLKRELCCSGIVVEDEELGKVIQLQGDHRKTVAAFLVKAGMVSKANVKIHGF